MEKAVVSDQVFIHEDFRVAIGHNYSEVIDQAIDGHNQAFVEYLDENGDKISPSQSVTPCFATYHKHQGVEWVIVTELMEYDGDTGYWETTVGTREVFDSFLDDPDLGEVNNKRQ